MPDTFIFNGNFFACYAPSKNYIVDDNLNAIPVNQKIINSDLFCFLLNYTYSDYDRILNIADLIATGSMIASPEKRILDIEKRRKIEGKQREFFISIIDFNKMVFGQNGYKSSRNLCFKFYKYF